MSLTLQQIIDMADARVPNTETDANKVLFLNELQNTLYSKFLAPIKIDQIPTVADQAPYSLPSYLKPDRIITVVILDADSTNPVTYDRRSISDELTSRCYYTFDGDGVDMINIYPEPTVTGKLITIFFADGPNALSSSDMTTVPRFFPDYHLLLVYGLAAELARIQNDATKANNLQAQFDELLTEAEKQTNDTGVPYSVPGTW